jgi:LCP family protein required for cell wall assembly
MKEIGRKIKKFFTEKVKPFLLNNNKRNLKIILVALAALIIILGTLTGIYINKKLNLMQTGDKGIDFSNKDTSLEDDEDYDFDVMHDVGDADSLNAWLKEWATNGGEKMSSKRVVNILLCGVDSKDGSASGARSDAMIIVSANNQTKTITLVSLLRDSYSYMNISGEDRYRKINAVYNWGGPGTLVETIENNYKIEIDGYASVDFKSFPKLIDSLGGVTVDVQQYEAQYINNHRRGFIAYNPNRMFPHGNDVKLQGQEALIYSRIRKCDADSDLSRTRRQRSVITALIESAKDATTGQLNNAMDVVFPHIRTSFTKSELLTLGAKAISQGWSDYNIVQLTSPDVSANGTGKSTNINSEFVWVVDYARAAQILQKALYGKSNIELDDADRTSPLDMLVSKGGSSGSGSSGGNSGSSGNQDTPGTPGNSGNSDNNDSDISTTHRNSEGNNNNDDTTTTKGNKDTSTTRDNVVDPTDTVVTDDGDDDDGGGDGDTGVTDIGDDPDLDIGDII